MIRKISRLDFKCKKCNKRADFCVRRTNDDLPDGYCKSGEREECFCRKHLPQDVKKRWNSEISDIPKQKI